MPRRIPLVNRTVGIRVLGSRKADQSRYELGLFVVDAGREKMERVVFSFFDSSLSDSELHGGHRIAEHTLSLKLKGLSTKVNWRAEGCSELLAEGDRGA